MKSKMTAVASVLGKMIDIGANLTDPMFKGIYHGSKKHTEDLTRVIQRAKENGVEKIIITGGNLEESKEALTLSNTNDSLFCTVGVHPTRCNEFEPNPDQYLNDLIDLIQNNRNKVVAVGEFGLDYERLEFCDKEKQKSFFEKQLISFEQTKLPLFLHCRKAADDLTEILQRNRHCFVNGVVHSFDGTKEEAKEFLNMGLHIGINGCSLKTYENLLVVKDLPVDRILIETDCPWCEIRPSHASYKYIKNLYPSVKKEKWKEGIQVKGRNEPINLRYIIDVLADVRGEDQEELSNNIYDNSSKFFKFDDTYLKKF